MLAAVTSLTIGSGSPATAASFLNQVPGQVPGQAAVAPGVPTINFVFRSNGLLGVSFTAADATATQFEATFTPQSGGASTIVMASPTALSVIASGLVNFETYDISLVARNAAGDSAPATATGVPAPSEPVQNLIATPGPFQLTVTFDLLAGATGYRLETDSPGVGPFDLGPTENTVVLRNLDPGEQVVISVRPVLPFPRRAELSFINGVADDGGLVYQTVGVERPAGALVMTQTCGVFGELPEAPAVIDFPGFTETVPPQPAVVGPGGAPALADLITPDPLFVDYPLSGSFPTYCDLDLGAAELVLDGPQAGRFFQTAGRLHQVTVVDTRDDDPGWVISGTQTDLVSPSGAVLDGGFVGWMPSVTATTDPVPGVSGPIGYDQIVTAGPRVLPGTGTPGSGTTDGLGDGSTLAAADPAAGLGIARLDAHIQILIPIDADAGGYTGDLVLTII